MMLNIYRMIDLFFKALRILLIAFITTLLFFIIGIIYYSDLLDPIPPIKVNPGNNQAILYYINLDKSKDRLNNILPLIKQVNLPAQRISAIDGSVLPQKYISNIIDKNTFKYFIYRGEGIRLGEIGCYLSHEKVWKEFLDSNYSYAVVLEDDVSFVPSEFNNLFPKLLTHKDQWDILKLQNGQIPTVSSLMYNKKYNLNPILYSYVSTLGYIINRKAAKILLSISRPLKMPVDLLLMRHWEMNLKLLALEPCILTQQKNNTTNIGHSQYYTFHKLQIDNIFDKAKRLIIRLATSWANIIYGLKLHISNNSKKFS